ncbi:MAG: 4Fe-4S dicluster domain-containing protein [Chlorobi bacterium]|nr:4Fe-4S dicluster domain-containing protein [Chlorobiota bacterium]
MAYSINLETCSKCRLCTEVCPSHVIGVNENKETYFIPERLSICLKCGQCMAVCQTGSITVDGLAYGRDLIDLPGVYPGYDQFVSLLSHRRSVRNYRKKPVPEEMVQQILETVSYAPFGASPEKMHVTVINNRERIEKSLPDIERFLDNIVKWINNPIASTMIRRKKGVETFNTVKNHLYPIALSGNYKLERGDRITRGAPVLMIFHAERGAEEHTSNAFIFATYVILAAQALGLGAAMNGIVPAAINKVKSLQEYFNIPENHEAVIAVIAGWPKYKYQKAIKRKHLHIHNFN